ncbi:MULTISPECIES: DUF4145 domain-containing protein [unclassified Achromobacter]|uniref:DUF4145 domain-containing protein n=1 Tax=unclassified Achromobacter TaxID=2626865 RepID=UPI000B5151FB|nr:MULTISPECIES: DUF4145 domain-containing protein [unclassified Achromobacter]OWT71478.1 hypothetical protein CEY05_25145 [Achromobacter sp. HZ34]OWT73135.1 hypothetical protein CEY04_23980 [Achromobacter sp. HZ28]
MTIKKIKSHCRHCGQETNHSILSEHSESSRDEYVYDRAYQVIECLGCETKSFRDVLEEIEHAYQIADDEWEIPTSITVYPRFIKNHRSLSGEYYLPSLVGEIYGEVLLALKEDALVLAGLGLRGTVEAVCNDLNIDGRNLEIRISKLASAGYISRKDAERLHGIRFMGNDAAHEIKRPDQVQLSVALKIVEHLLSSVYILEEEAQGKIDTLITEFEQFKELLGKKLNSFAIGDELPIIGFLGRDIRRVKDSLPALEAELIDAINKGEIKKLTKGKLDKYNNSKNDLQHYVLA